MSPVETPAPEKTFAGRYRVDMRPRRTEAVTPADALSADLTGRVALVVGCDRVSQDAAAMLLTAGAVVVVASPCAEKRARFTAHERLHVLPICLATDHGAMQVKRRIARKFGRLDLVVAALGSRPPPDRVAEAVAFRSQRVMDPDMDAHYSLARILLPLMAEGGGAHYLLLNDTARQGGAGVTARLLLKDALAAEARSIGVGVHTAVLTQDAGQPMAFGARVGAIATDLLTSSGRGSRTFRLGRDSTMRGHRQRGVTRLSRAA